MGAYIKALVLANYLSVAGNPHGSMSGVVSFVTFSLLKDKSAWRGFERPKAGPKGEGQNGLYITTSCPEWAKNWVTINREIKRDPDNEG